MSASRLCETSDVTMENFADRLLSAIQKKNSPCIVGLDPRLDSMPEFIKQSANVQSGGDVIRTAISTFHRLVIDAVYDLIPAVKAQSAFYEQYGIPGMMALLDTIDYAREKGLLAIIDAKRNDIGSTARAYASAFLVEESAWGIPVSAFNVDAITVTPYLGEDSLLPFVDACERCGKGIFVVVKTSNRGSRDFQDVLVETDSTRVPLYSIVGELVNTLSERAIGSKGYSSIGAVVGATFPSEASQLRRVMPQSIFLVPGFGAQGGGAEDAAACFNPDGLGAVVNASRSITYELPSLKITETELQDLIRSRSGRMIYEINAAVSNSRGHPSLR